MRAIDDTLPEGGIGRKKTVNTHAQEQRRRNNRRAFGLGKREGTIWGRKSMQKEEQLTEMARRFRETGWRGVTGGMSHTCSGDSEGLLGRGENGGKKSGMAEG